MFKFYTYYIYVRYHHTFYSFLRQCGVKLITLRLGCCQYISRETLETVVKECPVLEGTHAYRKQK